ncbi:MAG: cytidine deaminase [Gemmatimonadaceae bacterium]|nr:cytidine deaminase [Gemmatimonadaceae bacterium]
MADATTLAALRAAALAAMDHAYAPYSKFRVGAALLTPGGAIITGCNVENAAYPAGICAERAAIGAAVARGERTFTHVVVATEANTPTPPCGMCRQVLHEFAPTCRVISVTRAGAEAEWALAELLPFAFESSSLRDA